MGLMGNRFRELIEDNGAQVKSPSPIQSKMLNKHLLYGQHVLRAKCNPKALKSN